MATATSSPSPADASAAVQATPGSDRLTVADIRALETWFQRAQFEISTAELDALPLPGRPEIAFAGRSNAGKSSAINTITNRKQLAFASKTPGRTQLLNFFGLGRSGILVDLPGYGYAAAPGATRAAWNRLVGGYLAEREPLAGLVAMMDIRRPLTELDIALLEWMRPTGRPVLILLTKADKLTRAERNKALASVRKAPELIGLTVNVMTFSSLSRENLDHVRLAVKRLFVPGANPRDEAEAYDHSAKSAGPREPLGDTSNAPSES